MKKILSITIMAVLLLQNLAFAAVSNTSDIINCTKNTEDSFCNSINIKKEPIKLNTYLKKNYAAYLYTIENKQEHSIEISKVSNFYPSNIALSRYKQMRRDKRFPQNIGTFLITLIFPIAIIAYNPYEDYCYVDPLYDLYLSPIINTAFAPYLVLKDKKDDKKAKSESYNFNEKIEEITLKKDGIGKFAVLKSNNKRQPWIKNEIQINITDLKTNQKYFIYK